jgi:uncharacterized SAM-binding protein YcdF (DUF218 family)
MRISGREVTVAYTLMNISKPDVEGERSYWKLWLAGICAVLVLCFLRWGGYLLVEGDSLPDRVDAAVVLQGPMTGEKARIDAAMAMLQQGSADRVALSVPKESFWGEEIPPIARQYLEKNYGAELAGKVDFCETGVGANSTAQEEQALSACIQEHQWKTIALVTSNYHSRRAGLIWRKTLPKRDPSIRLAVEGVADPAYQPRGWWRQRLYAQIWFLEVTKLVWDLV